MARTEVMMLGGLGQTSVYRPGRFGPRWTTSYLPPARTTPQEPQNLLRQTYMNGLGEIRVREGRRNPTGFMLAGLGAGLQRTVAISLGRLGSIEGSGPTPGVVDDVDEALLSYDVQRGAAPPSDPFALEKEILDMPVGVAQTAARAAGGAVGSGPTPSEMLPGNGAPTAPASNPANVGFALGTQGASIAWGSLATVSAVAGIYHGYRRNRGSLGWGLWWGLMGATFPLVSIAVAAAQGFGKPRGR